MSEMDSLGFLRELEKKRHQNEYLDRVNQWIADSQSMLRTNLIAIRKQGDQFVYGYQEGYQRALLELKDLAEKEYETE